MQHRKVRVLFDHRIFLMQPVGGVSRYFTELIRALHATGSIEPVIFAGLHSSNLLASLRELGFRVPGLRLPFRPYPQRAFSLINNLALKRFAGSVHSDIYHATYYHPVDTTLGRPLVMTVHDMIAELYTLSATVVDPTPARKLASAEAAARIICVSGNTEKDLLNLYPRLAGKTTVVHHGSSFPGDPRLMAPLASPYLLYVGQRGGYKNASLLYEVLRNPLCRDLQLVFVGGRAPTPSELAHGLGSRITFIPRCSDDDLAAWYRHAIALVYPSRYEGFGMPPLEAMQLGCPVLASNASSLPEVVGDAGLLLDPSQSDDWVSAIGQLVADPTLRHKLSAAGQRRAREFTWTRCAGQVAAIYQEVLSHAKSR
jgi:glycosyltransferase involved in cell wall biosynthesis